MRNIERRTCSNFCQWQCSYFLYLPTRALSNGPGSLSTFLQIPISISAQDQGQDFFDLNLQYLQRRFSKSELAEMAPSFLLTLKPKRGSLTKQEVRTAVNPHILAGDDGAAVKLAIYNETPKHAILHDKKDCLIILPPEILSIILLELPMASYLDLVQTSKHLRQFIRANAARLCNATILSQFPLEARLISSGKMNGWIIPTLKDFAALEGYVLEKKNYIAIARGTITEEESEARDLCVKLSTPRPQFLLWLQSGRALQKVPVNKDGKVDINTLSVVRFLRRQNHDLTVNEKDDGKGPRGLRLREMLWYHGVPEN
jgi:hypothetical protein